METIGSYEAKTRLPELLRKAEQGQCFTVTRRGVPIARIVGIAEDREDLRAVMERMKAERARRPSVPLEELIRARDEGRRP